MTGATAATLRPGDITEDGEVASVTALDRRNYQVRVWFVDGTMKVMKGRQPVEILGAAS